MYTVPTRRTIYLVLKPLEYFLLRIGYIVALRISTAVTGGKIIWKKSIQSRIHSLLVLLIFAIKFEEKTFPVSFLDYLNIVG